MTKSCAHQTQPQLPASLRPLSLDEIHALERRRNPIRRCHCCKRTLPIGCFSRIRSESGRHTYCNPCRERRRTLNPSTVRKRGYVTRAKSKPCVDCGGLFGPKGMILVQTRANITINVSSGWAWHSEDSVSDALKTCVPVCTSCKRIRERLARTNRLRNVANLADSSSAGPGLAASPPAATVYVQDAHCAASSVTS
jgi:hypothetical protein